jgi:uncharacterized membrane protein
VQLSCFLSAIVVTAFHSANPSYESLAKADHLGSLVAVPQALEMLLAKVSMRCHRARAIPTAHYTLLTMATPTLVRLHFLL